MSIQFDDESVRLIYKEFVVRAKQNPQRMTIDREYFK